MGYFRLLLRVVWHERTLWVICVLLAAALSLSVFVPCMIYGGSLMRSEARSNLEVFGSQMRVGTLDDPSMPQDLRELLKKHFSLLEKATSVKTSREFYEAVVQIDENEQLIDALGYGDGSSDTDIEAHKVYSEQLSLLEEPPEYSNSTELPAILHVSLAPSSLPSALALLPGVAAAWVVACCTDKERLLGGAVVPRVFGLCIRCLIAALIALAVLILALLPPAAASALRNGVGDGSYPVVFVQAGEIVTLTAGECAAWTILLLALSNALIAVLGSAASSVFGTRRASLVISLSLVLIPSWPRYYEISSALSGVLPYLATSYLLPSRVVGSVGEVPTADLTPATRLLPSHGVVVILLTALICVCACTFIEVVCYWVSRCANHARGT